MPKPTINEETCIGCGSCESVCPAVFKMIDGKAKVIDDADFDASQECIKESIEACPVDAINAE